ncbi:NAD-dependent epimerase/dehydratase family protein [Parvibaculum sp.]|uniref:NAD-dependent epimerase/dehydratase family protein n=1 Tax=Parvibaculum sp. TaxID=2024848 RepID=UPI0034A02A2A
MKDKRVFVSGGAGVIGLEMIPKLVERGADVLVGDLKSRPISFAPSVRYRQGDLNEMTSAEMSAFAPEVFIHLAATFERSSESYGFWAENFHHNLHLSHRLMTLVKDLPSLRRVVFASSYLIYDQARYLFNTPQASPVSLREDVPIMPRNLTGMAKLAHEVELRFLSEFGELGFSSVCARIFRGYGRNSRDVISRWIRALLAGETISVYRPEGLFDYVYARDTAEGLIRMADTETLSGIVNLGTERARRVQDIVDILRTHFPAMQAETVPADIPFEASQADMTACRAALGWTPQYDLESAIPEMIAYERAKRDAAKSKISTAHLLVSSAARKAPLVRALRRAAAKLDPAIRVVAGDLDEGALARHVADDFWPMPRIGEEVLEEILQGCRARGIGVVVPTRDGELAFWARHRARFEAAGIDIVVSPIETVETCLDKLAFARFGAAHGLPFIPAALHPDELGSGPFVVKERFGAGARAIGLDLAREPALAHGATLAEPLYQPFIHGREISVDAWMDRTYRVKGLVLRHRNRVIDGESQVTTTFRDPAIEAEAQRVLEALNLRGPAVLQIILDSHDAPHVVECNTRFGGASTASIEAGLDMFYWSLLESCGANVADYPFHRIGGELRQIRLPHDIYLHDSGF